MSSARETTFLFVYGSLQRGERNHTELGAAEFISEVRTAPLYALCVLGSYPALTAGNESVRGELYRIGSKSLRDLDAFEGEGYARGSVTLADGRRTQAYFLARKFEPAALAFIGDRWSGVQLPM